MGQAALAELQPTGRAVQVDLGPEVGLGEAVARAGLLDPLGRDPEVLVLDQRHADQLLELRVLEDLPPGRVGEGLGLGSRKLAPGRWASATVAGRL